MRRTYKKKSVDPRIAELEDTFRKAQSEHDTDTIYVCIYRCVENILKGLVKGHKVNPDLFEDRVNEAQVLMCSWYHNKITRDPSFTINSLVNALYIQTVFSYRSQKHMFEDRNCACFTDIKNPEISSEVYDKLTYDEWLKEEFNGKESSEC